MKKNWLMLRLQTSQIIIALCITSISCRENIHYRLTIVMDKVFYNGKHGFKMTVHFIFNLKIRESAAGAREKLNLDTLANKQKNPFTVFY